MIKSIYSGMKVGVYIGSAMCGFTLTLFVTSVITKMCSAVFGKKEEEEQHEEPQHEEPVNYSSFCYGDDLK